ncbi:MAG: imidazoleglycerol-phosphate dehydratase HisB [Oscillospiraceae bacterium]|jgi:imidazoleglycerol-phosphate dehydratase|nr:imidazoleglycerol-phosphate dehydratase HisB [Oscillospiraceae bacterium]
MPTLTRKTNETDITATFDLYGKGQRDISTGIGFFDHMLGSFALHGGFDLTLKCDGDLGVDAHHTVEDVGIVLGKLFSSVDKAKITRFGEAFVPMDESLSFAAVDVSGRAFLVLDAAFTTEKCGEFDTCLTEEFFRAFAVNAGITLHLKNLYGANDHHKIESLFKAAAHSLKRALVKTDGDVLSTKGVL